MKVKVKTLFSVTRSTHDLYQVQAYLGTFLLPNGLVLHLGAAVGGISGR